MIEYEGIKFQWLGHDGFLITGRSGKKICIDPYQVSGDFESADIVISTHQHGDHCSLTDIQKFSTSETEIIGIPLSKGIFDQIESKKIHYVKPGDKVTILDLSIEIVPAYNINKFRSPGVPFHPKEEQHIGVIINLEGARVYHTGDTDHIPEMADFVVDVALLPVSGTYVMTAEEAIEAVHTLNPKLVIPMHFGKIVGNRSMAEKFKKGVKFRVEIPSID
ncbi:MAG: MBL fold metallo-hydrolase [Candidatus Hodarchaeota archaeon]